MISRVYVIDDDDQFRNSLCALIESVGLEVEGWGNPEDLLKKSSPASPRLRRTRSSPALALGPRGPADHQKDELDPCNPDQRLCRRPDRGGGHGDGASTVFEKPVDDNAFLNALERFCFEDAQRTVKRQLCLAIQEEIAKLSEVERSTLEQMQLGLSNKAIARKLSKSVKAIERHRQNVVRKLGCISAMEALQKVQACPLQSHSPLACIKEGCPTGRYINVK